MGYLRRGVLLSALPQTLKPPATGWIIASHVYFCQSKRPKGQQHRTPLFPPASHPPLCQRTSITYSRTCGSGCRLRRATSSNTSHNNTI